MGDMGDLFRALKEENAKHRLKNYDKRINYAIEMFDKNNIPYKLCNENNAHFNLYDNKGKVVISFWAWTGKVYLPKQNIHSRGIKSCCNIYNKRYKEVKV